MTRANDGRFAARAFLLFVVVAMSLSAVPSPAAESGPLAKFERATFGGGCFWCVEAVFETEPGVKSVTSGYAGGHADRPTYRQVCDGDTGHAEVVQIEFDPAVVTYERLLELFWDAHDPTTLNRQGADVGTQYRSIILFDDEAQRVSAEKSKATAQQRFDRPIVTEIVPLRKFFAAEDYHQDYFRLNGHAPYCRMMIAPKLHKLGRDH
jgi:peptide-methionine (S)-S-oxide reductase